MVPRLHARGGIFPASVAGLGVTGPIFQSVPGQLALAESFPAVAIRFKGVVISLSPPPRHIAMRAFSMVEILVVFAILSLVAATLLPVLQSSKLKALRVTDVSNLRQLGQARELYASDNDSVEILQTWQLKRGGYVVAKTLQSPLDQTSYGIGNCLWRYQHSQLVAPIVPWKDSYPSIRDGNGGIYIRGYLLAQPTVGWLVSPANGAFAPLQDPKSCLVDSSTGEFFSGSYLRLGLDGRIMTKHRARSDSIRADEMFVDNPDLTWNATH